VPPGFVSETDQANLYSYLMLNNGGLYIESVNLGKDHDGTPFFGLLGLKYIADGPDEAIHELHGQDSTMSEGLAFKYLGGHDAHFRLDELEARGSEVLFSDEENIDRIFAVDNDYKAISTSILMGAMMNGDSLNLKAFWISEMVDFLAGESSMVAVRENLDRIMNLGNNYPNPFRNQTSIDYSIKEPGRVRIDIFNLNGQLVRNLVNIDLMPGKYTSTWDGTDDNGAILNDGFFIYRMNMGGRTVSERMIMLK
jgi:hypothetical protein